MLLIQQYEVENRWFRGLLAISARAAINYQALKEQLVVDESHSSSDAGAVCSMIYKRAIYKHYYVLGWAEKNFF